MKNINSILQRGVFTSLLLFYCSTAMTQPVFSWVKQIGGTSHEWGSSIAIDNSGNILTCGLFRSTIDFDPNAGVFNMTAAGTTGDGFFTKLDASGNFSWAKQIGGTGSDECRSLATDALGNVYIAGSFQGTIDLDPGVGILNASAATGNQNTYISKFDPAGDLIWAGAMDTVTNSDVVIFSTTVDASGDVYIIGGFEGTVDFDPGTGTYPLTTSSSSTFISKIDNSGNFVWAKAVDQGGGVGSGADIFVDASGNVYAFASFSGTTDFDPGAGTYNLTSAGSNDIFVLKMDNAGNFIWARAMGGTGYDSSSSIAVDGSGNVYTTGRFQSTADFNPGAPVYNLIASGPGGSPYSAFNSKLDSAGNFLWAKTVGFNSSSSSLILDASSNVYTIGSSAGGDFDPGSGTYTVSFFGVTDVVIYKLDAFGNFSWARSFGGGSNDAGNAIAQDASGSIYTTGSFSNTCDFDIGPGTYNLTSVSATSDIFVHKMNEVTTSLPESHEKEQILIYPNPTNGIFYINNLTTNTVIKVIDLMGKVVLEQTAKLGSTTEIDLSQYSKGIYMVMIISDESVKMRKVILE